MTSLIKITTWKHKDIKFSSFLVAWVYIQTLFFLKISIYQHPFPSTKGMSALADLLEKGGGESPT